MTYREILEVFKNNVPHARAVVFCDHEGETIEFVSDFDSYHTQLFGAYQSELLLNVRRAVREHAAGRLDHLEAKMNDGWVAICPVGQTYYFAVMAKTHISCTHPAIRSLQKALEAEV